MVHVVASTRDDGDFNVDRVPPSTLERRRRALVDVPWTMLREVHGNDIVQVDAPGAGDRATGDALVTDLGGVALAVWVGDCAPVVLVRDDGRFALAHAGWRGLARGVLDVAHAALVPASGEVAVPVRAWLGPCIGPCCYEFDASDLDVVASAIGVPSASITGSTRWGTRSLDVPAAVQLALARHDVALDRSGACTGCGDAHFSHRMRAEVERHVVVAWKGAA